ncbi:MAG: hypothetical protein IT308_06055 [Anaerolineaceae bacterium]|nr:hypothetical protein [Anaerolineaceae bacterium]
MPGLITLNCSSCGAKIAVDTQDASYTCQFCGAVRVLDSQSPVSEFPAAPRPAIEQPADVYLEQEGGAIRLVRRWFQKGLIPLAVFCFFWDGFLFFWYWMALRTNASIEMLLGPIVHVIVGIVLTYGLAAGLLNRTEITFDRQQLSTWHGPLPWWGSRSLPLGEIRQLYTRESSVKKNGRSTYHLFYTNPEGRSKKLLSGLDSPDTALFIEQQLEAWLNIPDQPVQGELPR